MIDALSGDWSELLVGHVWPGDSNVDMIADASTNRGNIGAAWHAFSDRLRQVRLGPLSSQEGVTADVVREAFQRGEANARNIADKNSAKNMAYQSAYRSATELRGQLRSIAEKGNRRITDLQSTSAPLKIDNIVNVVLDCQAQANAKAALYGDNVLNIIQQILHGEGINQSARQFAIDRGVDADRMFGSADTETIRNKVQQILHSSELDAIPSQQRAEQTHGSWHSVNPAELSFPQPEFRGASLAAGTEIIGHVAPYSSTRLDTPADVQPQVRGVHQWVGPSSQTLLPRDTLSSNPLHQFDTVPQVSGQPAASEPTVIGPLEPPHRDSPGLTAADLASTSPSNAYPPIADQLRPDEPSSAIRLTPSYGGTAFVSAPVTPMTAAPLGNQTGPPPVSGTDIRPPVAASSAPGIRTSPPPAAPSSAPAEGTSRARSLTAVIRQPDVTSGIPARIGGQAAATAVASPDSTALTRLRLLVNSVARHEPRLRWVAGDRPDGSTVLATDVACGWIPPHVDIPAGVQLPSPTGCGGDLATLLGTVVAAAHYTPGQTLPPPEAEQPTSTSSRARRGLVVDDLGWELGQATKWRDGLPRLAHTLATAAATRTGVLAAETELLGEHLATVRRHVLDCYPDNVDAAAVGNWQLLAAVHALVKADTTASYHFAWFKALSAERLR